MIINSDAEMEVSLRWENPGTKRYYHVILSKDLFGQWMVCKTWGGINKAGGRIVLIACKTYHEAVKVVHSIFKVRKRRGYQLCTPVPETFQF